MQKQNTKKVLSSSLIFHFARYLSDSFVVAMPCGLRRRRGEKYYYLFCTSAFKMHARSSIIALLKETTFFVSKR
jgi:hypothetical protein